MSPIIVSLKQLCPGYRPVLMPCVKTLSPVQNSPDIYIDKFIIAERGSHSRAQAYRQPHTSTEYASPGRLPAVAFDGEQMGGRNHAIPVFDLPGG